MSHAGYPLTATDLNGGKISHGVCYFYIKYSMTANHSQQAHYPVLQ